MAVTGPQVKCHKCGANVTIEVDGKMPLHNAKGTKKTCVGSREKPN